MSTEATVFVLDNDALSRDAVRQLIRNMNLRVGGLASTVVQQARSRTRLRSCATRRIPPPSAVFVNVQCVGYRLATC